MLLTHSPPELKHANFVSRDQALRPRASFNVWPKEASSSLVKQINNLPGENETTHELRWEAEYRR